MNIEHAKIALSNARCDLSFAIDYPDVKTYKGRCQDTIEFITRVLDDHAEFYKLRKRWDRENNH